ncbi:hypothetical protein SAMN02745121_03548 [Nannocystis exedens]|uniref:Uncharacterized protein n=1 Tax=Nannocystis exedens TaxID=54 RepID=A0A1I1YUL2_9BACT|nr:hypothetical protein [Nannocystis exedens]PCC70131.1 hypothetical protein NAEX_03164 [Nannocystis exedens]SFE23131.1 hypothetical protein SAMN02745121_03548 [Nannocystis exedens]
MPRISFAPKATPDLTIPEAQPEPAPRPAREHNGPLSWVLGGAPVARSGPAPAKSERRREPAASRQPMTKDVRRRRSPSSGFRG